MSITLDEMQHVAILAKLSFDNDSAAEMTQRLNTILSMVSDLQKADVDGIQPMAHPTDLTQRLREDRAGDISSPAYFQKIAPLTADNLYLVPKVID